MTREQRTQLKRALALIAEYYNRPAADAVLELYTQDLEDLRFENVMGALQAYRKNPENKFPPLPATIREMLAPSKISKSAKAQIIVAEIMGAIKDHGLYCPSAAESSVSAAAWEVVKSRGGWQSICENCDPPGVFHSHLLKGAEAVLEIESVAHQQLPSTEKYKELSSKKEVDFLIGDVIKSLGGDK